MLINFNLRMTQNGFHDKYCKKKHIVFSYSKISYSQDYTIFMVYSSTIRTSENFISFPISGLISLLIELFPPTCGYNHPVSIIEILNIYTYSQESHIIFACRDKTIRKDRFLIHFR